MNDSDSYDVTQDQLWNPSSADDSAPVGHPKQIGRYHIERVLGKGGFGLVYLARDEQLERLVAVKVPHAKLIAKLDDFAAYLNEARTVANLDHPGIVPVHDVGKTDEIPCFVVSKYIEGTDLAAKLKKTRLSYSESAELVATVAEALHYAHKQGLVHRDVKPGNILIGNDGAPYVVDFGLALREENIGKGPRRAGTPAYMSPEQARGEGHRVDGRSDIFSLGVVLYELLSGRQPFRGDTQVEVMEQVTSFEAKPLRQYDEKLPKELERICHKAMAKRASERYSSAHGMADDLRHLLVEQSVSQSGSSQGTAHSLAGETHASAPSTTAVSSNGSVLASSGSNSLSMPDNQPIKIVPKGLRSFDAQDADFFLELLPGPRDRHGLPDTLRFWKTRIEEVDPDNTFSVGLIYGPSGCGKSSLVKAGLLPLLADDVTPIYVEATPDETEKRLLHGLRKRCPGLDDKLELKETLTALRRGRGMPVGRKVLIVLDQFEQWLHANEQEEDTALVPALRQCDGGRVQCIVMVRDDFWLAVSRFGMELEIDFVPGNNMALTDLFDIKHARKVLAGFGRAFGRLPDQAGETTKEQREFIKQAVKGLAEDGKIICVRLALFAEMMKGKDWTPAALKDVGGTSGIGVTFLEETFSAQTTAPRHRLHQKAARAVLNDLLPDAGTDIKGYMRSRAELLEVSGYGSRTKDFDDLVRILDSELRLITPTDPAGKDADDEAVAQTQSGQQYFQLAHDYLVHSLRDWLTRKQKESRKGRAELKLDDISATWNAKPTNRFLPSLLEWASIRTLTDRNKWTEPQQRMMRQAGRRHVLRSALVIVMLVLLAGAGFAVAKRIGDQRSADVAQSLVTRVMDAEISQIPSIVAEIDPYRPWADQRLHDQFSRATASSPEKLRLSLALLPVDKAHVAYLTEAIPDADAAELAVIRDALRPYRATLLPTLWSLLQSVHETPDRRFNAAAVLATYDKDAEDKWGVVLPFVADQLVETLSRSPRDFDEVLTSLETIRTPLAAAVAPLVRDPNRSELYRETALNIALEYAADNPRQQTELLVYAELSQFNKVFAQVTQDKQAMASALASVLEEHWGEETEESEKERIAKRKANASVALLRMDQADAVWPLFEETPDQRVRSYLIAWSAPLGVEPQVLIDHFDDTTADSVQRGLLLALGVYPEAKLPLSARRRLISKLVALYTSHPDSGLHGSAEWLLRKWEDETAANSQATRTDSHLPDSGLAPEAAGQDLAAEELREALRHAGHLKTVVELIDKLKTSEDERKAVMKSGRRRWYVTSQGHTFAVLEASHFQMGSPVSEASRTAERELQHLKKINRKFAISTTEVTRGQYQRFHQENESTITVLKTDQYSPTDDSPQLAVSWYDAAAYCNWLSGKEGIPETEWCYDTNAAGKYAAGMRAKADYLQRSGYRLPTEAEWEFACRGGTTTSRYYGQTEALLSSYARYRPTGDQVLPVGRLKPNGFGLFDMLGNAMEWCNEEMEDSGPAPLEADHAEMRPLADAEPRILRGGSFLNPAANVRAAHRMNFGPHHRYYNLGFRPSRTLPK